MVQFNLWRFEHLSLTHGICFFFLGGGWEYESLILPDSWKSLRVQLRNWMIGQ